jgi:hypothetical protein
MCALAVIAIILAATTSIASAWLPNIAVGAISIAITTAVVEELLRRAERERVRARVEGANQRLESALMNLINIVQLDFYRWRETRPIALGGNPVEVLTRWLEAVHDPQRAGLPSGAYEGVLRGGIFFAQGIKRVADEDGDYLGAILLQRMRDLETARLNIAMFDIPQFRVAFPGQDDLALFLARLIVERARDLATAYVEHIGGVWPPILVFERNASV